nr:GNAT family N-acetyltransferase [Microvirga puerhi]
MPEDVSALAAIAEASYRTAFSSILEEEVLSSRNAAFFTRRFEASWARMLVVCAGGIPAGFLLMTDGHIDMLFMDPAGSRKGGGSCLLHEAERCGAKSLECFRDNIAARRFYERHGWHPNREYEREFAGRSRSFVFYVKD